MKDSKTFEAYIDAAQKAMYNPDEEKRLEVFPSFNEWVKGNLTIEEEK